MPVLVLHKFVICVLSIILWRKISDKRHLLFRFLVVGYWWLSWRYVRELVIRLCHGKWLYLMYGEWIIYGFINIRKKVFVVFPLTLWFVFLLRIPMYSEAKLAFVIYLWYPKTMVRMQYCDCDEIWCFSLYDCIITYGCCREQHMCTIPSLDHMLQNMRQTLIKVCWN